MSQQQNPVLELTSPVGRLVGGHPMEPRAVTDDNGQPKLDKLNQPRSQVFIAVAVPKGPETGWWETEWGAQVFAKGQADWPGGEWQRQDFAWKIEDGDSAIPNKNGKKNCDREGYPGHWIIKLTTELGVKCYHAGHYDALEQIQDAKAIKPGDYCRVVFSVKGNGPSQSPGVYVNPHLFELSQVGQAIILEGGPSAVDAFGGSAPQMPANAQVMQAGAPAVPGGAAMPGGVPGGAAMPGGAPAMATPPAAAPQAPPAAVAPAAVAPPAQVTQAPDFLNSPAPAPGNPAAPAPQAAAPEQFNVNGQVYTREQLTASGWTADAINQLPRA